MISPAGAQVTVSYAIAPGPLGSVLTQFGQASGLQIFYPADLVRGKRSSGVSGALSVDAALATVLSGTGLVFQYTSESTVTLVGNTGAGTLGDDGAVALDPILVEGGGLAPATPNSALMSDDPRLQAGTKTVVTAEDLANGGNTNVAEAMKSVPGVFVTNNQISIGGAGTDYTKIMIDGVPVTTEELKQKGASYKGDLEWVPMDAIARIEVIQGPGAALYGSGGIGGVVNIITKKDDQERLKGALTAEYYAATGDETGSTKRVSGSVSAPLIKGALSMSLWGDFTRHDDDEDGGQRESKDLKARVHWRPDDAQDLTFEIGHSDQSYMKDTAEDDGLNGVVRDTLSLRHSGQWSFGEEALSLFWEKSTTDLAVSNTDTVTTLQQSEDYRTYGLEGTLTDTYTLGGIDHAVVYGLEASHARLADGGQGSLYYSPDGSVAGGGSTSDMTKLGLYAKDQMSITDRFRIDTALRYDYNSIYGDHLSPVVNAAYDITDALTFKAGIGKSFKAPNLRQSNEDYLYAEYKANRGIMTYWLGNDDLKPELATNYMAGFYYDQGPITGSVSGFLNNITNRIQGNEIGTFNGVRVKQYVNVNEARTSGIQGNLNYALSDRLQWNTTFSKLLESKDLASGSVLSEEPDIKIHTELSWQATDRLMLTGSIDHYGKQVEVTGEDSSGEERIPAYTVANVLAKYTLTDHASLKAGVNNIFDEQPDTDADYTEDSRTYFISASLDF
ncbi:TonB-dependent receptor domain-containing protein [Thioclava sp. GXIMD4215]|uniref:TonB-dependent receptor domain-containing protein n=1 Tax=Thioclava sp. GXIMD4215 TaxID=3131928 RepID=UPI003253186C